MNDLISRNAVEHLIMTSSYDLGNPIQKGLMMHKIESISSMDRPKGEWIEECECSNCHWLHEDSDHNLLITTYRYCPNCGADMRGTENEATSSL